MRRMSLRVGLSVFASATLLGGGAVASAYEAAPEEQCHLSSVLGAQDDAAAEGSSVVDGVGSSMPAASDCGTIADAPVEAGASAASPAAGAATQATMFGGISLALISASAAFAGIDWTPILIKLGSWF